MVVVAPEAKAMRVSGTSARKVPVVLAAEEKVVVAL
jgi:hypothetical protein